MNILIIGGGGREHALAWKAAQSPQADTVFVAPGNAGTAHESGVRNVPIDAGDIEALLAFASENAIGLTIVGPEAPLVARRGGSIHCGGPALLRTDTGRRATGRFQDLQQGFPRTARDTDRALCGVH